MRAVLPPPPPSAVPLPRCAGEDPQRHRLHDLDPPPFTGGEERFAKQTKSPKMGFSSERTPEAVAEGVSPSGERSEQEEKRRMRGVGRSSEVSDPSSTPHPTSLREATFSHKGRREGPTLPRRLHRAILRLLRPAESAVRRLIVIAARGLVVPPSPQRPAKPKP